MDIAASLRANASALFITLLQVPFKLLGDEAKGWLDTRYLSQRLRVSVGNKGTTFVLSRVV